MFMLIPRKISTAIFIIKVAQKALPLIEQYLDEHQDEVKQVKGKAGDAKRKAGSVSRKAGSASRSAAKHGRRAGAAVKGKVRPAPSHTKRNVGAGMLATAVAAGVIAKIKEARDAQQDDAS